MQAPKESKPNQAKDDGTGSKRDGNKRQGGKGQRAASFGNQGRRPLAGVENADVVCWNAGLPFRPPAFMLA